MIKLIIHLFIFAAIMFLVASPTLRIKPLSLKFDTPYLAIGWTIIIIGIAFIQYDSKRAGYNKCHKYYMECLEELKEEIKQEQK